jgi:hypothetical protein
MNCGSIIGLGAVIALSAYGQTQAAAAKASGGTVKKLTLPRAPDGKPDLDGVWSFAVLTPLERPAEFAGKATLTDQEAAAFAKKTIAALNKDDRSGSARADLNRAYNDAWWDYGTRASNQTSLIVDPADGKLPPLTPEGEKMVAERRQLMARSPEGPEDRPLWERCIMGMNSGPPMLPSTYNNNVQIFQTRNTVGLLNEMIHNSRIVPLDGRPHGTVRQWAGDSRGHWDDDILVVDSVDFTNNGTGTFGLRGHTDENLHLVERFTLKDANTLLYQFTVSDPTVWTRPWTAIVPMTRGEGAIYEYACHEGNYAMEDILSGARAEEKAAAAQSNK